MNRRLLIALGILLGAAVGIGGFTFVYARGASYLSTDPAACANCHIMREHFQAWQKASHHTVAGCSDCHMPHDPVGKYYTKAKNGFWHSFYFTTGRFPYPLRITEGNRAVTEHTCRYCHAPITEAIEHGAGAPAGDEHHGGTAHEDGEISCVRCHRHVGHLVR